MKKNFEKFLEEVRDCQDIEELESSEMMIDDLVSRKIFNKYQKGMYLIVHKQVEATLISNEIYKNNKGISYLRLINIVRGADEVLRGNIEALTRYCVNIDRQLKSKARIA